MRIGIVSDSHGDLYAVKRAVELMGNVDMIIHLGDNCRDAEVVSREINRDIICVRGNCDFTADCELEKILQSGDIRILITHGHKYNIKSDALGLYFKARQEMADLVLFGHTHFGETFEKDGIIFVNPGSVSRPRGTSQTYALITIEGRHVIPAICELY